MASTWSRRVPAVALVSYAVLLASAAGASELTFVRSWGGPDDGELYAPTGLGRDSSGNLYVAERGTLRIQKFDAAGSFVTSWGGLGTAEGKFRFSGTQLAGIAVDAADDVYVADPGNDRVQKFDSNGSFLVMWGIGVKTGAGVLETCTSGCRRGIGTNLQGGLVLPSGVAVDPTSGNVVVASYSSHQVQIYTSGGSYVATIGTGIEGTGDGELWRPQGVAVDAAGNIFVGEDVNARVSKFQSDLDFERQWATGPVHGVAIDGSGNVWVVDSGWPRIQKFDGNGVFLAKHESAGSGNGQVIRPFDVEIDGEGNVFVADTWNGRVQKLDSLLAFAQMIGACCLQDGDLRGPVSLSVAPGGVVSVLEFSLFSILDIVQYPVSGDRVQQYEADGDFLRRFGSSGVVAGKFNALGVGAGGDGSLQLADAFNSRVQKLDAMGLFERAWGWGVASTVPGSGFEICTASCTAGLAGSGDGQFQFASPTGVDGDAAGNVYAADPGNQRVQKFDGAGSFLGKWGSMGTSEGQFNGPSHLAIDDDGYVYVTDPGNFRIQKFDGSGVFQVMWGKAVKTPGAGRERCSSGCRKGETGVGQIAPRAIDVAPDGTVWVVVESQLDDLGVEAFTLEAYTSDGVFLERFVASGIEDGQFARLVDVALAPGGDLYLAETPSRFIGGVARVQQFTPPTHPGDPDADGVPDTLEDAAPNGGDGNDDGMPDSDQVNVASLPNAIDGGYLTLVSPPGTMLVEVESIDPATLPAPPAAVSGLPIGVLSFAVVGVTAGGAVEVELLLPPGTTMSSYYKFGSETGTPADHWYEFLDDGTTGAVLGVDLVTLRFVDGQRGDDDLTANGTIVEPGGPVILGNLDVDGDGEALPLTDGLLVLRYLFGFTGAALVTGAVGEFCTWCTPMEVEDQLAGLVPLLDLDGDGAEVALTDGLLVLRFLVGFTGGPLTSGAVSLTCTRCTAGEIETYVSALVGP